MTWKDHVSKVSCDFMEASSTVYAHPVRFCGHSYCGSGDIIVLVCHIIPQDQVTQGLSNMGGTHQRSHHRAKFGDHSHCGSSFSFSRDLVKPRDQMVI